MPDPQVPRQSGKPPAAPAGRWARVREHAIVRGVYGFYQRHERWAPLLFFSCGVVWDALTLNRIDAWGDIALLLTYLAVVAVLIVVTALVEHDCTARAWCLRYRTWFPHAIQFFLGALFSAHVIFYSQSADLAPTAVFLVLLVVLLVANEFIHRRLFNLHLLLALYFLTCASFFVFFVPVVTKTMSYRMFTIGTGIGLGLSIALLLYLAMRGIFGRVRQLLAGLGVLALLFGLFHLSYLQNWIPPVPLALRYGGIFHHAERADGAYRLLYEAPPRYAFWRDTAPVFHYAPDDTVYAFAAVFAPTDLRQPVYHAWTAYLEDEDRWQVVDSIGYEVVGGRNDGYRGYTFKRNIRPGRWRVDVKTAHGRLLGRIRFRVEPVPRHVENLQRRVYE